MLNRDEFNQHALAALDPLYNYALQLTRNPEDAADLVQETYARTLTRWRQIKDTDGVRPTLFRVLYNLFVDGWRAERRRPRLVPLPNPGEETAPNPPNGMFWRSASLIQEALSEDVDAALNDLDDPLRETLWLREIEDFSYAEIADITGVPVGTVRSRLSRARARMAKALREYSGRHGFGNRPASGEKGHGR